MACDCASQCSHSAHCIAIYLYPEEPGGSGECWVLCSEDESQPAAQEPVPLEASVNIETRNVDLAQLGAFVASRCEANLLIPAKSASEKVELLEKNTTLGAVLERAGLVVAAAT